MPFRSVTFLFNSFRTNVLHQTSAKKIGSNNNTIIGYYESLLHFIHPTRPLDGNINKILHIFKYIVYASPSDINYKFQTEFYLTKDFIHFA